MRLRDAVRYALYVSRAVGAPSGGYLRHRFGRGKGALRARFLDVIQKLLYHGYTEKVGHTEGLMKLLMTHPHVPENPWDPSSQKHKEVNTTVTVIKQFWKAVRESSESEKELLAVIKGILEKLYEQASGADERGFEAAYADCVNQATAVVAREKKRPALFVRRVESTLDAIGYVARDAVELKNRNSPSMDVIAFSGVKGASALLMENLENKKGDITDLTGKYVDGVGLIVKDYTVVISTNHASTDHMMCVQRCQVRIGKRPPHPISKHPMGVLGSPMIADADGFGANLRSLADSAPKGTRGLGSVVVFLVIGGKNPGQFLSYPASLSSLGVASVCVFFHKSKTPSDGFSKILQDAIIFAPKDVAEKTFADDFKQPSLEATGCKARRPDPTSGSSTKVETRKGNVVIDPFRRPDLDNQIVATTLSAEGRKRAIMTTLRMQAEVFYNYETFSRARTYAPGVLTVSGAVVVPEDGVAENFAELARCAALENKRVLQLVDASKLKTTDENEDAWLGVLVAMACNPRIMLVVRDDQNKEIAEEVKRVARMKQLPNLGARPSSGESRSGESRSGESRSKKKRDGDSAASTYLNHVTEYAELVSHTVHDACAIVSSSQKNTSIVIGHDAIDAIRSHYLDVQVIDDAQEALHRLLLTSVGSKNPILVSCTTYNEGEASQSIRVSHYDGAFTRIVDYEYSSDYKARDEVLPPGLKIAELIRGHTHLIFVVDVSSVPAWSSALRFWKSERGLVAAGAPECSWIKVLLARDANTVVDAAHSAVIIGDVKLANTIPAETTFLCGHGPQLKRHWVHTYDSSLRVSNLGNTVSFDSSDEIEDLIALVKCSSLTANAPEGRKKSKEFGLPIAVINVTKMVVNKTNVGHLVDIGIARNYILVTTREQSTAINKKVRERERRHDSKARRLAREEAEKEAKRLKDQRLKEVANWKNSRDKKRRELAKAGILTRTKRKGLRVLRDYAAAEALKAGTGQFELDRLEGVRMKGREFVARLPEEEERETDADDYEDQGARAKADADDFDQHKMASLQEIRARRALRKGFSRFKERKERERDELLLHDYDEAMRRVDRDARQKEAASRGAFLDDLPEVGSPGNDLDLAAFDRAADPELSRESSITESALAEEPVADFSGDSVKIFGEAYKVSKTGCREGAKCNPKDGITTLLQSSLPEKVQFLLVKPVGSNTTGLKHHAASEVVGKQSFVYLRCKQDGGVDAVVAKKGANGRISESKPANIEEAIANAKTIYVLCME